MSDNVIELKSLKKYYHSGVRGLGVQALDGLSLEVARGETFGLLGPNGAGKSTAIKVILGLVKPNSGSCLLFGEKLSRNARKRLGYLPEAPNFYRFLSARELVVFYARLCGMPKSAALESAKKVLDVVGLSDAADRRLSEYSKGMLQRAGLAQAIVHDPELVILDEPSSGLDPIGMADMADMIMRLKESGKTVLLCSHLLNEAENLCDRVAIVNQGKIAASGKLQDLLTIGNLTDMKFENLGAAAEAAVEKAASENGARMLSKNAAKITLSEYFKNTLKREGK
jgi:ABC-2 type transport system ATP-binding protein